MVESLFTGRLACEMLIARGNPAFNLYPTWEANGIKVVLSFTDNARKKLELVRIHK